MNKKERKALFQQCKQALFPLDVWYDGEGYVIEEVSGETLQRFKNIYELAQYAEVIEVEED